MRLRIHHGAAEVGGNCIELESSGKTLLLDLGLPLDSAPRLPDVMGLREEDPDFLGIVLSHPHMDHYGLLPSVNADVPVWLGKGAKRLLEAAAPFAAGSAIAQAVTAYEDGVPFAIGPFTITPYLMDHSAFDAYALLVEAGGRRVFYTGDFRGHGRKAWAFDRFTKNPPRKVDVLLMEGTTIGRTGAAKSEQDLEGRIGAILQERRGLMLACFSGQNIDRFVTFLRATMQSGRVLVIDAYMANLIDALGLPSLPDVRSSPSVRVFLPKSQKRTILRTKRFDLIAPFVKQRVYTEELAATPGRFVMAFRASMIDDMAGADLTAASLIYSLWPGYLDRDRIDLREWARQRGIAFHVIHSSGHAYHDDLKRMADAVDARILVPIHSAEPERYAAMFRNVRQIANAEWLAVV